MHLLPVPSQVENREGCYKISYETKVNVTSNSFGIFIGKSLLEQISKYTGLTLNIDAYNATNQIAFKYDCSLINETYEINISEQGVQVLAGTDKGLYYGLQTLIQIIKQHKRNLPALFIKDKPTFKNRAFYHDVTRGKVPTLDSLKNLADLAAHYKLNQLQLYVEHTYLFKEHSEIWNITEPLTAQEIMELDDYCNERFIELVPSLSTFGHLYEALRSESFENLNEFEDVLDRPYSWVDRMNHYTLNVSNKNSIKFVSDMIDQFIPLFRSKQFNICADETFDLGKGKNKALAEKIGQSKLYVDFLNKVIDCVKKHDREVMFWGDIIIKHPEHIHELPQDLICLNWWYWLNYDEENVKMIQDRGFRQYVCPGVHGWNRLMNDFELTYKNIDMMTSYGKKYGAIGVLNTDWGDYGNWNYFANSIPGLIYGAQFSWSDKKVSFDEINKSIDCLQFGLKDKSVMNLINKTANMHHLTLLPLVQWVEKNNLKYMERVTNDTEKIALDIVLLKTLSNSLLDLMAEVPVEQREYIEAYFVSTQGVMIFNNLIPYVKKLAQNEQLSTEGFMSPVECAIALENWLYHFKKIWLKRNKPSELYRIVEFVQQVCKKIRTIGL